MSPPRLPPPPSPPASLRKTSGADGYLAGDLIAEKYRLVRILGKGGMGVVWVAHNLVLDVHVAVKLLPADKQLSQPTRREARLLQEARTAAALGHPAICRAFDFGETHLGDPFVVSEMMNGQTLADLLDTESRLPATRAVQILLPIIDGLAVAHAKGIVHRDVKPDNIFLSLDVAGRMQPKLLDFGIARFVESDSKLTQDGSLLGTPDYMSPEQAQGKGGADFRTDVWGTCVVLYEAVTGHVPFQGENYNAILYSVMNDPAPSILEKGAGDKGLWRLLERGLRKEPEERWQSMRELGEALALWLYDDGIREDVCRASLRTTWLESGLSEVQLELPDSVPPPLSSGPASRRTPSGDRPRTTLRPGDSASGAGTLEGHISVPPPPPRSRRTALIAAAAGTLLAGAGVTAGLLVASKRGESSAEATSPPAAAVGQTAAPSPSAGSAASGPVVTPEISGLPLAPSAQASAAPARKPVGKGKLPTTVKQPPKPEPEKKPPAAIVKPPAASQPDDRDFGF